MADQSAHMYRLIRVPTVCKVIKVLSHVTPIEKLLFSAGLLQTIMSLVNETF